MKISSSPDPSKLKVIHDPDLCMICGAIVRGIRNALGISQIDLAALLGVTRSTVVRLEQGATPLKSALCYSAMNVFEAAGVKSDALRDILYIGEGYPAVIDFSINFQSLKHLRQKLLQNTNSSGVGKLLLGEEFKPPLQQRPLRKKTFN